MNLLSTDFLDTGAQLEDKVSSCFQREFLGLHVSASTMNRTGVTSVGTGHFFIASNFFGLVNFLGQMRNVREMETGLMEKRIELIRASNRHSEVVRELFVEVSGE